MRCPCARRSIIFTGLRYLKTHLDNTLPAMLGFSRQPSDANMKSDGMQPALTTVDWFTEFWKAHLFRMRLEAEGIPAFVIHEYHTNLDWTISLSLGGTKVQVPTELYEEANEIRIHCNQGQFRKVLEDSVGDLDENHCPNCGSTDCETGMSMRLLLAAILSTCLVEMFPPRATIYDCNNCLQTWKIPLRVSMHAASLAVVIFLTISIGAVLFFGLPDQWTNDEIELATYPFSRYPDLFPKRW
jgi:hypothetical protein